jgi:hypothetical protein
MSGHLTIEKIAELRRSLKREANMYQKSGNDHNAAHLRITADLLREAEVALERVRTADNVMYSTETLRERAIRHTDYYDYDNQCWVVEGKIQDCAHLETMNCKCYGRLHAGETATIPTSEQAAAWDNAVTESYASLERLALQEKD